MPAATCATLPSSKSKPYTCNNDTDEDEHENCIIITSRQPQHHYQEQSPSPPNRRRRILLFSSAAAAAAAILLIVASIVNTSAHGSSGSGSAAIRQLFPSSQQHQQGPGPTASSVDVLDARDVLLMAEREALAFKRDAAGLQRTNDRLKAELSMPSQEAKTEKEEARQ